MLLRHLCFDAALQQLLLLRYCCCSLSCYHCSLSETDAAVQPFLLRCHCSAVAVLLLRSSYSIAAACCS
jgi:hypothetical protein